MLSKNSSSPFQSHGLRPNAPALFALLALVLLACGGSGVTPSPEKPNVVYILSDTHRWGAMSFTQTPGVQTPNLQTLKEQGASFNRYYVNLPICTPYRALMMTGRWPYQQGLMANHMSLAERVDLPEGEKTKGTLSWAFKNAGYRTAHIGKWHLGGQDARPFGFDQSIIWMGTNNHRKTRYQVDGGPVEQWEGESNATATTLQALEWIEQEARTPQPFFVVISLNPPHGPFHDAPDSKKALYPNAQVLPFHPLDKFRNWEQHRDYHALISGIDDDVKRVTDKLSELEIAAYTIVVYTSDHGAMSGVDGVAYGQKRNPHDESARVPFLVRWPERIRANLELDTLSSSIDIFPTLAGLASLADHLRQADDDEASRSLDYLESLPGYDLSPNLLGEPGGPDPESVFLMHPSNMNNRGSRHELIWRAIVTSDYTYAVTDEGEYALWPASDGYQDTDLVNHPETLEVRRKLWSLLNDWVTKAEAPFLDNWFATAAPKEIEAWNKEHGFGDDNDERQAGRGAVFNMENSRPAADKKRASD